MFPSIIIVQGNCRWVKQRSPQCQKPRPLLRKSWRPTHTQSEGMLYNGRLTANINRSPIKFTRLEPFFDTQQGPAQNKRSRSNLSFKSADVWAGVWKGRSYLRSRYVTPISMRVSRILDQMVYRSFPAMESDPAFFPYRCD